ncbi:MAG: phosphoglucomutase (alpha-D-glucose-1,6-bisphosphate-dependent) [Thermoguttaceae bacterium]|nr:phosphoglucomutase (alpha-D-glucose-1,6-bisphosphate-dependent) [Thermoguttaceae bacterium]
MDVSELAGKPAPKEILIDPERLRNDYFEKKPDPAVKAQRVRFGTGGHRGSPLLGTFTEAHIRAIVQAVAEYRRAAGHTGPLFLGRDTHAVSEAAHATALSVLAGNSVPVIYQKDNGVTPTPAVSRAILAWNRTHHAAADGLIITPSHNPPSDGGIKYNTPNGGGADVDITSEIEMRANEILEAGGAGVSALPESALSAAPGLTAVDYAEDYVADLEHIIDFETIRRAKIKIGVDPLGGAALRYWKPIAERYGLDLTVVNESLDPTFSFMTCDRDGKIRMDCSSPWSMTRLIGLKDRFDVAFANDPDSDRHGIVVPSVGLMNPNHFLAVAIKYLVETRKEWPLDAGIGKTLVSSGMIDRVAAAAGRRLVEVPVGFKWFVPGLFDGSLLFGGEESAGASFLRFDGGVWTTDKDGLIMGLLAAEILARTGKDPGVHYRELTESFGSPVYARIDTPATLEMKEAFARLSPENVTEKTLAGEAITSILTRAPGNDAPIGGLKVATENGWFAARPSGTENIYKIYAESFLGEDHLNRILAEAETLVDAALK